MVFLRLDIGLPNRRWIERLHLFQIQRSLEINLVARVEGWDHFC